MTKLYDFEIATEKRGVAGSLRADSPQQAYAQVRRDHSLIEDPTATRVILSRTDLQERILRIKKGEVMVI